MPVVVIDPPERVVTVEEARAAGVFSEVDDDEYIETLLEIAQSEIDGPTGWFGRSIGEQILQVTVPRSAELVESCLPYPPFIEIVSDEISADGCNRVVQYRAGQIPEDVPKRIKHAIIMMAGVLRDATPSDGGSIKRETVEGIGSTDYSLPDGAADAMKSLSKRLLSTYRVYA